MKRLFYSAKCLRVLVYAVAPAVIYFLLLHIPYVKNLGAYIRYGFDARFLIIGLYFYFCLRVPGCRGDILSYCSIQLLFALALVGLWWNAFSELQVFNGIIYFSDAFRYYSDTQLLLSGGNFTAFTGRHPLAIGFFSGLLWITGNNLQIALIFLVSLTAGCIAVSTRVVKRSFGPHTAAVYLLICFFFYRRFTGLVDTENLGLAAGCTGLVLLLLSTQNRNPWLRFWGLLFQSLGLVIRPGAFVVLPFLFLWFYKQTVKEMPPKRALLLGCCALIIPFAMQSFVIRTTGDQRGAPFSNYAYTLYGITSGGEGWEQFGRDFPEYNGLPEPEIEKIAFTKAAENFLHDPMLTMRAIPGFFAGFFGAGDESVYGFITEGSVTARGENDPEMKTAYNIIRGCLGIMSLLGVFRILRKREEGRGRELELIKYGLLGIFLGIPFLPPRDTGMMRVYASVMPFLALLPALSLGFLPLRKNSPDDKVEIAGQEKKSMLNGVCLSFILFLAFCPGIVKMISKTDAPAQIACPGSLVPVHFGVNDGSYLYITGDSQGDAVIPKVTRSVFLERWRQFPHAKMLASVDRLPEGTLIAATVDWYSQKALWVIISSFEDELIGKDLAACGKWDEELLSNGLGFLVISPDQIYGAK